jgi:hypothetical protein
VKHFETGKLTLGLVGLQEYDRYLAVMKSPVPIEVTILGTGYRFFVTDVSFASDEVPTFRATLTQVMEVKHLGLMPNTPSTEHPAVDTIEPDAIFRQRILTDKTPLSELDYHAANFATGAGLDVIGLKLGLKRRGST